jgi:hypothetical protein
MKCYELSAPDAGEHTPKWHALFLHKRPQDDVRAFFLASLYAFPCCNPLLHVYPEAKCCIAMEKKNVGRRRAKPVRWTQMKAILDFPFEKLNVFLVQAALSVLLVVLLWRFVASHLKK